jgi:glycosyltransferase involved in cell wall biosynthesis
MKILIVSQYFPPETGAPQARLFELATRLKNKGHDISVLTAMPNYPTGKVFSGYRWRLYLTEKMAGIPVVRTAIYPSISSKTLPRLLSYFSFVLSSVLIGSWRLGRHDVVLVESPPLFLAPAGWIISKLIRGRSIFMVSDIWPDILIRMGHASKGFSLKAMLWLEKWAYRHYDTVALTNPGAAEQIRQRFPEAAATVISNGVDTSFFRPDLYSKKIRKELGATPDQFLVGYCGLHGLAQGLDAIIEAADHLRANSRIRFAMVGDGPVKEQLVAMAKARNLNNLLFLDRRPKSDMPAILASCDAMLIPLLTRLPGTMPSKVYEAFAAGTPPLVTEGCEAETLVRRYAAGLTFVPMDGKSLAQAVLQLEGNPDLREKMRQNCLELAKRFDRDLIAERTERILQALTESKPLPEVSW